MYADVVFPFRLKPLTYKTPEDITDNLLGSIVKAPIQGKQHFGLVISMHHDCTEAKNIRYINEVCCAFASNTLINFLLWMSKYYLSSEGIALRSSFFKEAVSILKNKKVKIVKMDQYALPASEVTTPPNANFAFNPELERTLNSIASLLSESTYKAILIQPNKESTEQELLIEIIKMIGGDRRGIIILTPEIRQVKLMYSGLTSAFGERLGMFHSKMKSVDKRRYVEGILKGQIDILVGTRSSIFAPIDKVSLVVVMAEHSDSYKAEEGLRYNARDSAVMLGYMYNCPVLLSSISPSIESAYNGKIKKYSHFVISDQSNCRIKPIMHPFKKQLHSALSEEIMVGAKRVIDAGGSFIFVAPREGFSLLYCTDCGRVARCLQCGSSMIYLEALRKVACDYCKKQGPVKASCDYCNGYNMLPIGGGIDRIKREMEIFIRENKKTESSVIDIAQSFESLIIKRGGKHFNCVTKEIDGAAIIDFDHLIHRFGFRAQERTFQDVLRIASIVKQKGTLFIQTNNPKSVLIKSLKAQDYNLFYDYELSLRRSAGYPPFKKLIAIEVNIKGAMNEDKIRMGTGDLKEGIELLGPLELAKNIKGCDRRLRYIVRSSNKKAMDAFVRDTQKKLQAIKGVETVIEVDPLVL